MPVANINGVNLHYEVAGEGKAIVLVHGFTGSTLDWEKQIPVLSRKYKVVALEMRGHGKSEATNKEEDYYLPVFADDIFDLLKMLKIEKCCLVGFSMGGIVSLEFVLEHPEMVALLALVSTTSGEVLRPPGYARLRLKLNEIALKHGMESVFEYDAIHNPQRVELYLHHPEQRDRVRQNMLNTSVEAYVNITKATAKRKPLTPRLGEIKVPAIILYGEEDTPFSDASKVLHKGIAGSELITFKGVGHSLQEQASDLFNRTLFDFMSRNNW